MEYLSKSFLRSWKLEHLLSRLYFLPLPPKQLTPIQLSLEGCLSLTLRDRTLSCFWRVCTHTLRIPVQPASSSIWCEWVWGTCLGPDSQLDQPRPSAILLKKQVKIILKYPPRVRFLSSLTLNCRFSLNFCTYHTISYCRALCSSLHKISALNPFSSCFHSQNSTWQSSRMLCLD